MGLKGKHIAMSVLFLLAAVFSGLAGYAAAASASSELRLQEEAPVSAAAEARTAESCVITRTVEYSLCGHTQSDRLSAGDLGGLTVDDLEERFPRCTVTSFSKESASLYRRVELYCSDHCILSLSGDSLILSKAPFCGDAYAIAATQPIDVSTLDESVIDRLKAGMVFYGEEAATAYAASLSIAD